MKKLKNILQEVFEESPQVDKYKVVEGVKNFGIVGKALYNNNNIVEIAKQLSEIAESAHHHILGEQDDWFDKVSVSKNMKSLKGNVVEFQKTAKEANQLNQRLTGLYEDIGHVLNRYYEISEDSGDMDNDGKDEPDSEEYMDNKDAAIKKAMKKEDKGDMDNDGKDEPDSEEYMDNKDKAIKKAMKSTKEGLDARPVKKLSDIGGVVGIPSLSQFVPKKK